MTHAPQRSEGGRLERRAVRAYLRRQLTAANRERHGDPYYRKGKVNAFESVLLWVLGRQKRYDKRKGGL